MGEFTDKVSASDFGDIRTDRRRGLGAVEARGLFCGSFSPPKGGPLSCREALLAKRSPAAEGHSRTVNAPVHLCVEAFDDFCLSAAIRA